MRRQVFDIPYFSDWFARLDHLQRIAAVSIPILVILLIAFSLPSFDQTNREDEIGS
jgi:hypothetical protein